MISTRTSATHASPTTAAPDQYTDPVAGTVRTGRVERGEIAACFPLAARRRPTCPPLRARLDRVTIAARAAIAETDRPLAVQEAGKALTGAALIARDCHQPDRARQIVTRHIELYTGLTRPLTVLEAGQVVGAATSLARTALQTDPAPDRGVTMLIRVLEATYRRAAIMLDGVIRPVAVPLGDVNSTPEEHRRLVALAQAQLLVGGTAALARAGRWAEAADLARTYGGSGTRLLEGRQVLAISRLLTRDGNVARDLVAQSDRSSDIDYDVAACLTALCAATAKRYDAAIVMVDRYRASTSPGEGYAYFRARYGAVVAVIARGNQHPAATEIAARVAREALGSGDGYAAQEVLRHATITGAIPERHRARLEEVVEVAGLTGKGLTGRLLTQLQDAVELAAHAVRYDL
ncbi:hypothetical protein [Promicromonospora sp. AC04]|uniref:hypothetical protein n=1 Tax=Promicromonospora sp. AC04 TaxID=2135723 RepID=UPI0011B24EAA|nr:hypothetical protein [Promicromonospora sp. AC04]